MNLQEKTYFTYGRLCAKTSFETEVIDNSEMAASAASERKSNKQTS